MKIYLLCIVAALFLCSGCVARSALTDISKEIMKQQSKNVKEFSEADKDNIKAEFVKTCGYDTGIVRGLLGSQYEWYMSLGYQEAADDMDEICQGFPGNMWQENQNLGILIGATARAEGHSIDQVKKYLEAMIPKSLKYFKILFGL
jgi:hypothetical protein